MEILASVVLVMLMILVGLLSKKKEQKNQIAAAYLLLGSASIPMAILFNNMYSLVFYGIAFVSYLLAFIFALKLRNYKTEH